MTENEEHNAQSTNEKESCNSISEWRDSPWDINLHPQGWVYFSNSTLQTVTDDDIRQPGILQAVLNSCSRYVDYAFDEGMEVHVHAVSIEGAVAAGAGTPTFDLIVNHEHCVASYDMDEIRNENIDRLSHWSLNRHRRLYWNYLQNHPAHTRTPKRAAHDAVEALTWYYTDNLISGPRSIVPFSKAECEDLFKVLRDSQNPISQNSVARTVFLSWLLREISSFRYAEEYGQYTLKQSQAQRNKRNAKPPAQAQNPSSALLMVFVSFVFFSIPKTYLAHVKAASEYRGRLSNVQQNWQAYIDRLVKEYSDFLLISTVLLSATVGFLSVGDVGVGARVGGLMAAFASLGSMVIGVFCIWRHSINTRASDSFIYMHNARTGPLGLHGHAVLLSLPPVLLVWASVMFAVALILYTIQGISTSDEASTATAWTVLAIFFLIFFSVAAGLYTFSILWTFRSPSRWTLSGFRRSTRSSRPKEDV